MNDGKDAQPPFWPILTICHPISDRRAQNRNKAMRHDEKAQGDQDLIKVPWPKHAHHKHLGLDEQVLPYSSRLFDRYFDLLG